MKIGKSLASLMAVSSLISSAYAIAPGLYLGFMAGPATSNASTVNAATLSGTPPMTPVSPMSRQFGSRIYLGYKANEYMGTEFGFTYFSTIAYDNKGVQTCGAINARARDIDLVARLSYPFAGFEPYAKAGAAVVYSMTSGGLNSSPSGCGQTQYNNQFKPTYSLGVGYDLNQSWVADLSANTVVVPGAISSMTYYALGFSYHFTDKYCGQFLCDD